MRYFIELSFKGTRYHGWQSQPNAISVQTHIEKALSILAHNQISITGAGRTDSGVHARGFVAHFDLEDSISNKKDFLYKMNALIPEDIAIHDVYEVMGDAHARFSAISRSYKYTITSKKDPFMLDFSWYISSQLDLKLMNEACEVLKSYDDFTSFSKLHSDVKNNRCLIRSASWQSDNDHVMFDITANRFLRNMVRSIVGTMVDIGKHKLDIPAFKFIIEGKNRNLAGFSVPPQGLMLYDIKYPDNIRL